MGPEPRAARCWERAPSTTSIAAASSPNKSSKMTLLFNQPVGVREPRLGAYPIPVDQAVSPLIASSNFVGIRIAPHGRLQ